ncbi:hypothetical protein PXW05_11265 [Serratia marcescens]|uniref:hypothetical protein n=2 Tax=Serratia TaxID=613 RepID=UPI0023AF62FD|nr:hypothetical protein [Serratia marcescens]WEE06958.1 hypothetical protein PXW05_11265 [Serratia marcescens]
MSAEFIFYRLSHSLNYYFRAAPGNHTLSLNLRVRPVYRNGQHVDLTKQEVCCMKKLLLLLGLCTSATQAAVIVAYPYAAPRTVVIAPAPIVVTPAPVAAVAHPLALTAGAAATGAYRHHERQDAYDEINHLQQQRIDELNHLQAQRINNFNSRHPR